MVSVIEPPSTPRPSARFGPVIRQLRDSRGRSQERLAGLADLSRSCMGEIERSAAMPSRATAEKLARALEVALSELISRCEAGADRCRGLSPGSSSAISA